MLKTAGVLNTSSIKISVFHIFLFDSDLEKRRGAARRVLRGCGAAAGVFGASAWAILRWDPHVKFMALQNNRAENTVFSPVCCGRRTETRFPEAKQVAARGMFCALSPVPLSRLLSARALPPADCAWDSARCSDGARHRQRAAAAGSPRAIETGSSRERAVRSSFVSA